MKYTIEGFSQQVSCEFGLSIEHLLILRWFIDFRQTDRMKKLIIDGIEYYSINYQSVLEDLPILNIGKDRLYRKFKDLAEKKILIHNTIKQGGTYSYYGVGVNYLALVKNTDSSLKIPTGYGENNEGGTVKITEQIDQSIKLNSSTKYTDIPISQEEKQDRKRIDRSGNPKNSYGEFENVWLSDPECEKLIERYGEARSGEMVEHLSAYLVNNPKQVKKYSEHYAVILSWVANKVLKEQKTDEILTERLQTMRKYK